MTEMKRQFLKQQAIRRSSYYYMPQQPYGRLNKGGDKSIIFNEIHNLEGFFDDDIQDRVIEKFVIIVKKMMK